MSNILGHHNAQKTRNLPRSYCVSEESTPTHEQIRIILYEEFIVHIDLATLKWLLTIQESSDLLIRWRLRLAKYNFQTQYKKESHDVHDDAVSKLFTNAKTYSDD